MSTLHIGGSRITAPSILGSVAFDYNFTDAATMTQGINGTGAAPGNGDPVGFVNDQSGNGYHIAAASGSERPIYQTGVHNGQAAVLFDGVNDMLARLATSNVSANRGALTLYAVVKHTAAPTGREPYIWLSALGDITIRAEIGTSTTVANVARLSVRRANADSLVTINGSVSLGTSIRIVSGVINYTGDSQALYVGDTVDGTATPPGTSGANTQNTNGRIYIGGQGISYLNGHYFRATAFWAAHDANQQRLFRDFLRRACHI